jgi:large subunit ribosomal protein L24
MDEAMKTKLKKDDQVKVISGKDKGKTGRILRIDTKNGRVIVQGINMVKKAVRPKKQGEKGGIIDVEASLHISNIMLVTKSGDATKAAYKIEGGEKVRISRKTGETL